VSPFVSPSSAIARAHDPTLIGSVALRKGPRRFCPHRSDCCRVLMLTCRNSPLWQRCERCNNAVFVLAAMARSIEQRGHHVTCFNWNEPSVSRLQLCVQRLNTSWWIERYPKGRSRTCYQECGCHLYNIMQYNIKKPPSSQERATQILTGPS